ncbi:gas vesicle protein [Streptosporangium lutulentum]|uniref:Gas vesicle structural protein n=1 Tax=Streptosporangium lutulentum TaxID=1461250 RepID=A0ABT9QKY6_9ACTN|nr:gas vesicle protein [Streptosporangium lutulentum]MDP9846709.1 hypothetical protein [Streptosporangium lutulentum]
MTNPARFGSAGSSPVYGGGGSAGQRSGGASSLGDILERVLDRGVVIAGDIRVNLLDIELLTIKLRLVIASVDTARELGIDWWEHDPWLTSKNKDLIEENRRLRRRLATVEGDDAVEEERAVRGDHREYRSLDAGEERGRRRSSGSESHRD